MGYLASKLLPQKNRELKGLTWYTRDRI